MKRILIVVSLFLISTSIFAQKPPSLSDGCWFNGYYRISAENGGANGKIEVTTYTKDDVVIESTFTVSLSAMGDVTFKVSQPDRTQQVYVRVRWFIRNADGSYTPQVLNNGKGDDKTYLYYETSSNRCYALALNVLNVKAERIDSKTIKVQFSVDRDLESTELYRIKISTDGKTFVEKSVIFPDGATANKTYSVIIKL